MLLSTPTLHAEQVMTRLVEPGIQKSDPYEPIDESRNAPAPAATTVRTVVAGMSATGRFLCGGAAVVAIGSLLPWGVASHGFGQSISSSPRGGGPILLMALAAAALWSGWPSLHGELSKRRLLVLGVFTGILAIFVFTNWSDLGQVQGADSGVQISAGAGLYLYTAGVGALVVGAVRSLRARRPR
jgi:hypothetical protein